MKKKKKKFYLKQELLRKNGSFAQLKQGTENIMKDDKYKESC